MSFAESSPRKSNRLKFIIGGVLFAAAVAFMVISASKATAEFFLTIRELQDSEKDLSGQNLRVSGAVLGESIFFDRETEQLHFTIAHIPGDEEEIEQQGGLNAVLHQAVVDPDNPHLDVIYSGPQPDMLRDEAQAIVTGTLGPEGIFIAEELLLKCPTKYEESLPEMGE